MRSLMLLAAAVALSGCLTTGTQPLDASSVPAASGVLELVEATWDGRITATPLGLLAHNRDTETLVADVQREGFVFEITEVPQVFQAKLNWPASGGTMMVMVSSPHVDGKGVEYFTDMSAEPEQCLRIPTEGIVVGKWQVMAHSAEVHGADFTFTVTTLGGKAAILEGEPHSSAEAAETTEAEELPCGPVAEA